MEDMPEVDHRPDTSFLCKQHNEGLTKNTEAIGILAKTLEFGFKAGEERMNQLGNKIADNHNEIKEKLELHGKRLDTLEGDVWMTRKAKLLFYWIGGFSGLTGAVLWITGPLKYLVKIIVN
jgi:hypothetical protein